MFRGRLFALLLAVSAVSAGPAAADLSIFVASVGFDEEASLNNGVGAGVRWGKSSSTIGGETSLMVTRPSRQIGGSDESATAIFYDARLLVNIPLGVNIKPFVGVGIGAITLSSTDVPTTTDDAVGQALSAVADAQTNRALSYGAGARYSLNEKLDIRLDARQYSVFSVTALTQKAIQKQIEGEIGIELPALTEDKTVIYREFSIGLNFAF
jgi:opacity protein-like surface antigen